MSYEILTGKVPFKGQSSIDTLLAHQDEPVPPLQRTVPTLPDELCQLIEAMLAKDPDGRPTLAAVRTVLKRLRGSKIPTMTAAGLQIMPADSSPAFPVVSRTKSREEVTADLSPSGMTQDLTQPRLRTPVPGSLPLPPPLPSTPMPAQPPPMTTMPGYSAPPQLYPQGSMPPQPQYPRTMTPPPGQSLPRLDARPPRRRLSWVVILIAATIAAGIGIAIALAV